MLSSSTKNVTATTMGMTTCYIFLDFIATRGCARLSLVILKNTHVGFKYFQLERDWLLCVRRESNELGRGFLEEDEGTLVILKKN